MYIILYKVGADECTSTRRYRRSIMKTTGIFIGALGVCVVVALVVGFAGAAVVTPHLFGKAARNEANPGPGHGLPGDIIDKLEQQGVDVSTAKTAIQNGDTAALKSWLEQFRASHTGEIRGNKTGGRPC